MPILPHRPEDFATNLYNIHKSALDIVRLRDNSHELGVSEEDAAEQYRKNVESLSLSAESLVKYLGDVVDEESSRSHNLSPWYERKKGNIKEKNKKEEDAKKKKEDEERKKKEEERKKKEDEEEEKKKKLLEAKKKKEEEERKRKEEEEKKRKEEEEKESTRNPLDEDGEEINLPPDDSSLAEAKPVGLAVAGAGGTAASKPIATAVVGRGGLAIARPVGTAIAGVQPNQTLVPIYAQSGITKGKESPDRTSEYLNRIINRFHQV